MITIIDAGGANLASVANAFERLNCPWQISKDPDLIYKSEKVLLPGVGSAKSAMDKVAAAELTELIPSLSQPTLGICLGMQLLFDSSEEGSTPCLGMISGEVSAIPRVQGITLRHMGWNQLLFQGRSPLLKGISEKSYVYFVHSFMGPMTEDCKAYTEYGSKIPALVERDNFFGAQFHPEKSAEIGQQLLRNFIEL